MSRLFEATMAEEVAAALAAGEDIEGVVRGFTPLMHAVCWRRADVVRALITAGANVNAMSRFGITSLHFACLDDSVELVSILIAAGADVNARNIIGSPLFCASGAAATTMLCDAGADIEARDHLGWSVLECAVLRWNWWSKALVLISRGADVSDPQLLFHVLAKC